MHRSHVCVLLVALASASACKNDGRSPGLIEGVANDVETEVDGAGESIEGVGQDVTNTVDPANNTAPPPAAEPAADEASSQDETPSEAASGD